MEKLKIRFLLIALYVMIAFDEIISCIVRRIVGGIWPSKE